MKLSFDMMAGNVDSINVDVLMVDYILSLKFPLIYQTFVMQFQSSLQLKIVVH